MASRLGLACTLARGGATLTSMRIDEHNRPFCFRRPGVAGVMLARQLQICAVLVPFSICAFAQPAVTAPALVIESGSQRVLFAEDADRPWYPASLTKLMTAYLTFEAVKLGKLTWQTDVVVSARAVAQPPVKVGLRTGQKIRRSLAVQAMIVGSANDLATVLAEAVAGGEPAFVTQMNATANRLGMTRSNFTNASGLPDVDQVTSARDMALLTEAILHDYPEQAPMFAAHEARVGRVTITTVNGMLVSFDGADGMKTGFTCAAGYNVVATATRNGRKLIAVVLGERSRDARSARAVALLEAAFKQQAVDAPVAGDDLVSLPFPTGNPAPPPPVEISKSVQSAACGKVAVVPRKRGVEKVANGGPKGQPGVQAQIQPRISVQRQKSPQPRPAQATQKASGFYALSP